MDADTVNLALDIANRFNHGDTHTAHTPPNVSVCSVQRTVLANISGQPAGWSLAFCKYWADSSDGTGAQQVVRNVGTLPSQP
jgi:hypothetical protein